MITIIALFIRRVRERGAVSDVISADRGQGRQLAPLCPKGALPSAAGIPELIHTFLSTPLPLWPGRPWPGSLADLRPPARRLGATFPKAGACQKLCGEKLPLGVCVATIARRFWQRLCFKAALTTEIQMGSNWPTRGSPGRVTPPAPRPKLSLTTKAMPES